MNQENQGVNYPMALKDYTPQESAATTQAVA